MQSAIPAGTSFWIRRLVPPTAALGLLLMFGLAQSGFAQANPPLTFGNNYFVTGDYVVAGAYGLNVNNGSGMATGTINIPDTNNKGLTGTNQVPAGAQIVLALLYWQTVENTGVPSGQNGFFRPVFTGGPQAAYPIRGVNAGSPIPWAPSGCSGKSTGEQLSTYRAEVTTLLPQDASGNVIVDGTVNNILYGKYEVRLPSSGSFNHQPFTLGATLVIIFSSPFARLSAELRCDLRRYLCPCQNLANRDAIHAGIR